ncbi:MAG: hypothetical protein JOZ69_16085, partial [Myxococcales bacterium]|nr:hypothetical protein [Myxococcales bacterium]
MNGNANPGVRRGAWWLGASLLPVLGGLAASAMLAVDYARPHPVFCAEAGGCEAVRQTVFAAPLGVPMPWLGLVGFLAIGVASLLPGRKARIAQVVLSAGAGVVGLGLLAVQAKLGAFCPYCCVADLCAVLAGLVSAGRLRFAPGAQPPQALTLAGAALLPLVTGVPLGLGSRANPVPAVIRDEMAHGPNGKVTIVDFMDFECPFCRMTHAEL